MSVYTWDWSKFVDVVATLGAAGAGSWAAFLFNNRRETAINESKEKNAANLALLRLCRQYNVLAVYKRDSLNPYRTSSGRHIQIEASVPGTHEQDRVNQDSLTFLIEYGHVDVLSEILLEDDRFDAIMKNIYKRAEHHQAYIQPALEKLGKRYTSIQELENILGVRHSKTMQHYTDNMYIDIDASIDSLFECMSNFHSIMKSLYPNEKFVKVNVPAGFETAKQIPQTLDFGWKYK